MDKQKTAYVIANFGGPRSLDEIYPFLQSLLTDPDVIRTSLPSWLQNLFFSWIAKRRTPKIQSEYISMGGKSPIFEDTEAVAEKIREFVDGPVVTYHRYIPATHSEFIEKMKMIRSEEIRVFPMFPQFTYATTGSLARWFERNLPAFVKERLRWIRSYPGHPVFIDSYKKIIRRCLEDNQIAEEEAILLFSAHGIPKKFVDTGDNYPKECELSFAELMRFFPKVLGRLSYQSKFGRAEWIKPYTIDVCNDIASWRQNRKHVIFVPIAFTSDHIETICEIENEYMSVVREKGLHAYRASALNRDPYWVKGISDIIKNSPLFSTKELIFY